MRRGVKSGDPNDFDVKTADDFIAELQQECQYSEDGGSDDDGNDLGSVDSLIAYNQGLGALRRNGPYPEAQRYADRVLALRPMFTTG